MLPTSSAPRLKSGVVKVSATSSGDATVRLVRWLFVVRQLGDLRILAVIVFARIRQQLVQRAYMVIKDQAVRRLAMMGAAGV